MKSPRIVLAALLTLASAPVFAQGVESLLLPSPPANSAQPAQPALPAPVAPQPVAAQPVQAPAQTAQQLRDEQFQRALEQAVPITPDQITVYRTQVEEAQRATVAPLSPGKPVSRSIRLSLKPGEVSPTLRTQPGTVSTLTFSDVTGQPWPVLSVVTGNPSAYVAQSAGEPGQTNIIVVSAIQPHVPSNLVVTLVGYPVPVTITLDQGYPEVDYRLDAQITTRGPNAQMDMVGVASLAPTDDSNMMAFLDGVPPEAARKFRTTSSDVEAWEYGDMLYIRTPGDLLSPAYIRKASNVSGVNVFVLNDAPVLLVSRDGMMTSVMINR